MDSPDTQSVDLDHQDSDTEWSSPARSRNRPPDPALPHKNGASGSKSLRAKRDEEARQKYETYIASLPYAAESVEEMQDKLAYIVSNILTAIAAEDFKIGVCPSSPALVQNAAAALISIVSRTAGNLDPQIGMLDEFECTHAA